MQLKFFPPVLATLLEEQIRICRGHFIVIEKGSLTTSASADLAGTIGTEVADPASPTLPRATKLKVSGKLRRSASAMSKSSN